MHQSVSTPELYLLASQGQQHQKASAVIQPVGPPSSPSLSSGASTVSMTSLPTTSTAVAGDLLNFFKLCLYLIRNQDSRWRSFAIVWYNTRVIVIVEKSVKLIKILFEKSEKLPVFYVRYIDDIFGIWTGTEEELKQFHKTANEIHPNIQLDLRQSNTKTD